MVEQVKKLLLYKLGISLIPGRRKELTPQSLTLTFLHEPMALTSYTHQYFVKDATSLEIRAYGYKPRDLIFMDDLSPLSTD